MATVPDWQQLAIYAVGIALIVIILQRLPVIGGIVRFLFSFGILAFAVFLLLQQAPYQPTLARFTQRIGLDNQTVAGNTLRVQMSSDGHFWVDATVNGTRRRMLVDSGATVTAISAATANEAGLKPQANLVPVILQTANGAVRADTATVPELKVGNIVARDIKVVVSPAFGEMDVIGMNFLSKLKSWRVEGDTLVLVPHHPQAERQQTG